jgi:CDGSH-type Zn-finger protein
MATFISSLILYGFLAAIVGFIGKFIYDFQQNKKQTPSEDGFEFKDDFQKLAGIKPYSTASLNVPTNVTTKKLNEQIVDALLKAAENSEFPKPDESMNVQTTKIGTIHTNFGDNDPLATIPMSRVSVEGKKKMAEIAKEDINVQIEKNVEKFATLTNQTKCGCGRSETGFCTGLHRIPKKAWADGVRDIPAEKPKRKYTKKPKA